MSTNKSSNTTVSRDSAPFEVPAEYLPQAVVDTAVVPVEPAPVAPNMMVSNDFTAEEIEEARRRMAAQVANVASRLTSNVMDHIKFKGSMGFIMPDGSVVPKLKVVIVAFTNANTLFSTGYTPGKVEAPLCYAISTQPTNLVPRANSPAIQHDRCDTCPKNQFKSASNGKGKACRNARRMAVLVYNPSVPVQNCPMMTLEAPPTSLKAFDRYVAGLAAQYSCLPLAVVTEISMVPENTYAELVFKLDKPLSTAEAVAAYRLEPQMAARIDSDMDMSSFN